MPCCETPADQACGIDQDQSIPVSQICLSSSLEGDGSRSQATGLYAYCKTVSVASICRAAEAGGCCRCGGGSQCG